MLSGVIDYILSLRDQTGGQVASLAQFQVIIPNFPPLTSINYSVVPAARIQAYILYEFVFGEAMVPHSFDVKIRHGADTVLDVIVSGRFTTIPSSSFAFMGRQHAGLNIMATNLRTLTNYYELTTSYVSITDQANYNIVIDALRRMHTSKVSEELASQANDLLRGLEGRILPTPAAPARSEEPRGGARR